MNKSFIHPHSLFTSVLFTAALLLSIMLSSSCGGSKSTANPSSVTGNWTVTLYNSNNTGVYVFTTALNQENGSPTISSPITGSNLNLTSANKACFDATSSAKQTGVYTVSGNFNGLTATTVQLSIEGSLGNLGLLGTFVTNSVSGFWTLSTTGPNTCETSGTFLMTRS